MLQSNDCNVVVCRDRDCKLCSTSDGPSIQSQAYIVYTCESTKCKLCREETDVLLDLFCPFNSLEDIAEMTRKLNNITETPWSLLNEAEVTHPAEHKVPLRSPEKRCESLCLQEQNSSDRSQMLRAALQGSPGQMKDRQGSNLEIIQNLQAVDDGLLTDLERELKVDELTDLPELMDFSIYDLISR